MTTWLFVGPSVWPARPRLPADVALQPPIAANDVYRALDAGASRLAIVDGYFGDRPSVRHKEILRAMDAGVPVLGAASMGALRAAELEAFGMIGIGAVHRAYATGRLNRDADVAVVHAPAEMGWQPLTVALVDVMAELDRHRARGRLSAAAAQALLEAARAIPFRRREPPRLAAALRGAAARFGFALPATWCHARSRKRQDALALIRCLRTSTPPLPARMRARTVFEEAACGSLGVKRAQPDQPAASSPAPT
jgi:hypothetical protein